MAKPSGSDLLSGDDTSNGAITTNLSADVWQSTGTFASSAVYTGVAEPILGIAQIVDQATGAQTMSSAKDTLNYIGICKPDNAKNNVEWHAQMLGNAVGMMLPYLLLHKAVRSGASTTIGADSVAVRGNIAAMSGGAFGHMAATEAALGFTTGFAYDSLFRPSSENFSGLKFVGDRLLNGVTGGVTMGTLSGSSLGLARLGASEAINGSLLKSVLSSPIGTGVLSAVPSGLVSAEAQALRQGKLTLTAAEAGDAIYQMAFVGGALGAAHRFGQGGRNDLKYQDIATILQHGKIESVETPVARAERLGLATNMEQTKVLAFGQIKGRDGTVADAVIRPFEDDSRSYMRLARADVTARVSQTIRQMSGVNLLSLPLVLRDKVSIPVTDGEYNVTMSKPGPVMIQENGGKQFGTQIREWANKSVGLETTAEAPIGTITKLMRENPDVNTLIGRAAFDNLFKGNIDLVEFSQQTIPEGRSGKDLAPSKSLRIVSIDNKNDFSLLETPSWGFGAQFGMVLEISKALESKRLSEVSPKLQSDAEALLRVFGSSEGKQRLLGDGLSPQEIDAAHTRLTSLVNKGFPKHLGETNFYADPLTETQLSASLNDKYGTERGDVHKYLIERDETLVLVRDRGPLRIERGTTPRPVTEKPAGGPEAESQ